MLRHPGEEDELIECPYDKAHQIRRSRLQPHLIKCRRNHSTAEMATCPFDSSHIFPEPELALHTKSCPQRQAFEVFHHQEELIGNQSINTSFNDSFSSAGNTMFMVESPENWDKDPDIASYDPRKYAESAPVFRHPTDMKPSERREFRLKERKRLMGLQKKD